MTVKYSVPINSVINLTAPINNPCAVGTNEVSSFDRTVLAALGNNYLSALDKAVIDVCYLNGCRISELLNIKVSDITNSGNIRIKGLKNSNSRLLLTSSSRVFFLSCKSNFINPFSGCNRFYYYRLFKRLGIILQPLNSEKYAVCHSFRHNLLINNNVDKTNDIVLRSFIGQKSTKSFNHYVIEKK